MVLDQIKGAAFYTNTTIHAKLCFIFYRATPIRARSDIGARQRVREINLLGGSEVRHGDM